MNHLLAHNFVPVATSGAARPRRAFTMAEVLFAIIILGLGLILLAAAFPVGIAQTQKTQDATNAGLVARLAYDQMTKVPATGTVPPANWAVPPAAGTTLADWPGLNPNPHTPTTPRGIVNYGPDLTTTPVAPGKALAMGFLDGTQTVRGDDPDAHWPDLRLKLVYPFSLYSEAISLPLGAEVGNPTWSEDCPQHESTAAGSLLPWLVGRAAFDNQAGTGVCQPVPYALVWGFRNEGNTWLENVSWVYSGDRRYYWYAFYRQMYEAPFFHPSVLGTPLLVNQQSLLDRSMADHITRRTYCVSIVVCKVPQGQQSVEAPQVVQARNTTNPSAVPVQVADLVRRVAGNADGKVNNKLDGAASGSYSEQWTRGGLAPVRVPADPALDATPGILNYNATNGWISDGARTDISDSIARGFLRRGGIVLDCWGNIYQVADMTTNAVRLDRPLQTLPAGYGPGGIGDCLPLWFNPNGIAVFPTIMTKQADLP
jgi:type II secretory pathway pseudopilin PulG